MTQTSKPYRGKITAIDLDKQCFTILAENQKTCTLPLSAWQEPFDPQINDEIQFGKNAQGVWARYADTTSLIAVNAFADFENTQNHSNAHFEQDTHSFNKAQSEHQQAFYHQSQKETLYDNQIREPIKYPYGLLSSYFFTWKRCFDYEGRSRRKEYWYFGIIFCTILVLLMFSGFGLSLLSAVEDSYDHYYGYDSYYYGFEDAVFTSFSGFLVFIIIIAFIHTLPMISLNVRRFHDIGLSGWWSLLCYVPYLNILTGFFIGFKDSDPDENDFGEPVK